MNSKKIIVGILTSIIVIGGLSACKNNENPVNNNMENQASSGFDNFENEQKVEEKKSYNNGGNFVQYEGKTYYREYSNTDFEKSSEFPEYTYSSDVYRTKYINVISENGRVENLFKDDGVGGFYIIDDLFFFSGADNKLYSVNMKGEDYRMIAKGEFVACNEEKHKIYYRNTSEVLYELDTKSLKITKLNDEEIELPLKEKSEIEINKDEIISSDEIIQFKEKYNISSGDTNYFVSINNMEIVDNKVFYFLELSKYLEKQTNIRDARYERIATEVYMYDINTKMKSLLYLYKVSDKEILLGEDIYGEFENSEEPLAENEMYLEIAVANKGLSETFDIRVEEAGGFIVGKRVEYEGVHSRSEEKIKIKVTKEIGAMLTVYIDGKIDSQMVIEE